MRLSVAARGAMLAALGDYIGPGGKGKAYTGTPPAGGPEVAATGTLLFTQDLASPDPLQAAINAIAQFNEIADATAGNSGSVGYYRIEKADGTGVIDYPASELTLPGAVSSGSTVSNISLSASIPQGA